MAALSSHPEFAISKERFMSERAAIRSAHDITTTAADGTTTTQKRLVLNYNGVDCSPYAADTAADADDDRARARTQQRASLSDASMAADRATETYTMICKELDRALNQRSQLAELVIVLFQHLRTLDGEQDARTPATKIHSNKTRKQLDRLFGSNKSILEEFVDYARPTSVIGCLFETVMKTAGRPASAINFPPALLHFALLIANTSATVYRKLRAIFPCLPSARTIAAYNDTGDAADGVSKHALDALARLLQTKRSQLTAMSRNVVLEYDEIKVLQVSASGTAACAQVRPMQKRLTWMGIGHVTCRASSTTCEAASWLGSSRRRLCRGRRTCLTSEAKRTRTAQPELRQQQRRRPPTRAGQHDAQKTSLRTAEYGWSGRSMA